MMNLRSWKRRPCKENDFYKTRELWPIVKLNFVGVGE